MNNQKKRFGKKFWIIFASSAAILVCAAVLMILTIGDTPGAAGKDPGASGSDGQIPADNAYIGSLVLNYQMHIDDDPVDSSELSYFYGLAVNAYINTAYASFGDSYADIIRFSLEDGLNSLEKQDCPLSGYEGKTWADYFMDTAAENLLNTEILHRSAIDSGISLEEADYAAVQESIDAVTAYCESAGIGLSDYLESMYGAGTTLESLRGFIEKAVLVDKYTLILAESFSYTEAELEDYYHDNRESIDTVSLRYYAFEQTDEGKAFAEAFAAEVTDEASFKALALKYCSAEDTEYFETDEATARNDLTGPDMPDYIMQWAYGPERASGEVSVLEGSGSYDVVMFLKREVPDYRRVKLRIIQCKAADSASQTSVALFEKALERAQEYLDMYNAGERTEKRFAEMAAEYSDEDATKAQGGLYSDVSKTDVAASVAVWCFDESRKPGDVEILATSNGYCVVYFSDYEEKDYLATARARLSSERYSELIEGILSEHAYKIARTA